MQRLPAWLRTWTVILGALAWLSVSGAVRWNGSPSMPRGLWRRSGPFDVSQGRGRVVLFCPPPTAVFRAAKARGYIPWGPCPGGLAPMLKPVVAIPGDRVRVGDQVWVNGRAIAGSRRLAHDGKGRPLPTPPGGVVPPGAVWVLSAHHPASFDSRYFGALSIQQIQGVMQPLWLWE